MPRTAARAEDLGPFTLFITEWAWPYYARPRRGGDGAFGVGDVFAARERLRELEQPEHFEWVHETAPGLAGAVRESGLEVLALPLMELDRTQWRAPEAPAGVALRFLDGDDPAYPQALAVAEVGFGAEGTAAGPEGRAERDAAADGLRPEFVAAMRERLRRGHTVTAVAESPALGPVAVGSHRLLDGVSEIVAVATLPAVRRQGLGGAVTGALVEDALARGAEVVFLSAGSDAIARVYARLGFRRVGTACFLH